MLVTFLSAATFVVGCDKEKTTSQQIDQVKTETKQAAPDMKDYTFAEKDEFVKYMQGQFTALNLDLDKLSAKIESSSDAVKAEAKPKLEALRDQAAKLNQELADASERHRHHLGQRQGRHQKSLRRDGGKFRGRPPVAERQNRALNRPANIQTHVRLFLCLRIDGKSKQTSKTKT